MTPDLGSFFHRADDQGADYQHSHPNSILDLQSGCRYRKKAGIPMVARTIPI